MVKAVRTVGYDYSPLMRGPSLWFNGLDTALEAWTANKAAIRGALEPARKRPFVHPSRAPRPGHGGLMPEMSDGQCSCRSLVQIDARKLAARSFVLAVDALWGSPRSVLSDRMVVDSFRPAILSARFMKLPPRLQRGSACPQGLRARPVRLCRADRTDSTIDGPRLPHVQGRSNSASKRHGDRPK